MTFPAYSDYRDSGVEWLGIVPEHWGIKPLRYLGRFRKGLTITKADLTDTGIPCLSYGEVHSLYPFEVNQDIHPLKSVPAEYLETDPSACVKYGDFVFADTSEDLDGVGNFTHVSGMEPLFAGYHTIIYGLNSEVSSRFLAYCLDSFAFRTQLRMGVKGVKVFSVTQEILRGGIAWLPTTAEQTQIARFLDHETARIDALIEEQQRLIELLKEKRQSVIAHAVTKGLDPTVPTKDSGVEWLGEVPEHWRSRKVKRLFTQSKRQGYTDMEVLSVYRDYGVVKKSSRDDNNNKTPDDLSLYQLVMAGDLVVNKMKAWQGSLGVSEHQGITSPDYVVYSPAHEEVPKFLHYLLRASHMPKVYLSISNGIRPSQWRIEPEKFEQIEVFLPGKAEQLEIVTYLENQLTRINELMLCCEQASNFFSERRSALISAVVTGKIDVRGWQPPASASTPELALEAV
jgi:type I restriction enzyme S subunit